MKSIDDKVSKNARLVTQLVDAVMDGLSTGDFSGTEAPQAELRAFLEEEGMEQRGTCGKSTSWKKKKHHKTPKYLETLIEFLNNPNPDIHDRARLAEIKESREELRESRDSELERLRAERLRRGTLFSSNKSVLEPKLKRMAQDPPPRPPPLPPQKPPIGIPKEKPKEEIYIPTGEEVIHFVECIREEEAVKELEETSRKERIKWITQRLLFLEALELELLLDKNKKETSSLPLDS